VDVHGAGYEVMIPISTFDRLRAVEGVDVDLRTHLHIRETAHTLYGFATGEERGVEAWRQALEAGVPVTGRTVHLVDEGMDTGPILLQERVPILPGDTAESLHARIQQVEHRLYPEAIRKMAGGQDVRGTQPSE
jgi:hypothetical protein